MPKELPAEPETNDAVARDATVHRLWYTRRNNEVRGPFPVGLIKRYVLLGRLTMTDELSIDQIHWQPVADVPEIIPPELKADPNDAEAQQKLMLALRREDERAYGDRRNKSGEPSQERRRKDDRRAPEPEDLVQHREVKTNLMNERKTPQPRGSALLFVAALFIVAAVGAGFMFMPQAPELKLQCETPANERVNWSNCKMEGINLAGTHLAGARVRNANFSGANLQNSELSASDWSYTNLSFAEMSGANLAQALLVGTTLRNTNLGQANLANANLSYAILQGAHLGRASLENADLGNADLTGAHLEGAKLDGANLVNAIWIDRGMCKAGSIGKCVK